MRLHNTLSNKELGKDVSNGKIKARSCYKTSCDNSLHSFYLQLDPTDDLGCDRVYANRFVDYNSNTVLHGKRLKIKYFL